MHKTILSLFRDSTRRHIIINTLGNYLNVFFAAIFVVILTRLFTQESYGVLGVLFGITYVLATILDFGTTATIFSYVPTLYIENDPRLYRFIKSTFFYQSLFSLIVVVILFFSFPYLDRVFFKTHVEKWVLDLTLFSVLLFIWQNFFTNILLAAKKFVKANLYLNIANVIKTVVILIMAYFEYISIGSVIFVMGILGPLIFFTLIFLNSKKHYAELISATIHHEEFRFGYSLPYFVGSQFYNLGLRMDLFLLSYFEMRDQIGYYALAQKIILTIITSIVSITQVLSPGFAMIKTQKESYKQLKTSFLYLLIPSAIFIVLYFTPAFVFQLIFTENFSETEAVTKALALPFILSAIGSVPLLFLLYTVKKPWYILYSNVAFFAIVSAGSYYLIPLSGMFGPPTAIWWAFIVATAIQIVAMIVEFRKLPLR